ncbi:hypothetical protein AB0B93_09650, partial [Streptomyces lavendulae]
VVQEDHRSGKLTAVNRHQLNRRLTATSEFRVTSATPPRPDPAPTHSAGHGGGGPPFQRVDGVATHPSRETGHFIHHVQPK